MDVEEIQYQLAKPFPPNRVHWRVGNKSGSKGMLLAYLDARDVMYRLDTVLGIDGWQSDFEETPSGRVICRLSLRVGPEGSWVTKADGAGSTGFEGEKGGISDALKRAAVNFGIGRYLYHITAPWVELDQGKYIPRDFNGSQYLPDPAAFSSKQMKTKYYKALKRAAADDDSGSCRELWDEMDSEQQQEIWRMFGEDSGIRSTIKTLLASTGHKEDAA